MVHVIVLAVHILFSKLAGAVLIADGFSPVDVPEGDCLAWGVRHSTLPTLWSG